MWILTVDQEGSRRVGDRVDTLLDGLAADGPLAHDPAGLLRPFARTVGDEVQAVLDDSVLVVDVALHLLDLGGWSVGIGAGPVDLPLPADSRAGSGPAFVHAREAVEAAKSRSRSVPLAVRGVDAGPATEAEAALSLLGALRARRTPGGRAVVERLRASGGTLRQGDLAAELGISQQAVSGRLRTALWAEEVAMRPAAARLLRLAAGDDHDDGRARRGEGEHG